MTETSPPSSRLPRSVRVLLQPVATFTELIAINKGYGSLFGFLAIEYVLAHPLEVASHVMRAGFSPVAAATGLWSSYVSFALPVGLVVFGLGLLLYYALRFFGPRRLDVWTAASVLAYAYVPHVLLTLVAVVVGAAGFDHPLSPAHPFRHGALGAVETGVKVVLELSPSAFLSVIAVRTCFGRPPRLAWTITASTWVRAVTLGVLAVTLLAGGAASLRVAGDWRSVRPVMPGDLLPSFALLDLNGGRLESDALRGQVALFDFWATWCPPCVAAMPELKQLDADFRARGFKLVSVNAEPDHVDEVRRFVAAHALTFPVYVDPGMLTRRFNVQTFPTLVLVSRRGQVQEVFVGSTSASTLRAAIGPLLDQAQ
ncbi:MAG: TlpA family protein disulfide reductase [Deltaproteobacteria bacterium]|nr:TlpA family protein disulfide reductase [Deltaproteobacteria bacterium]